jgi:hypothetical protein
MKLDHKLEDLPIFVGLEDLLMSPLQLQTWYQCKSGSNQHNESEHLCDNLYP